jgi:hypothetical protein
MRTRAFTIVEVVVSLALMAGLMAALSEFVLGMGDLWGQGADGRLFERHISAVSHRLQDFILSAGGSPGQSGQNAVSVLSIRTEDGRQEDMLTWELPGIDDSIIPAGGPRAEIVCAVEAVPGRGLAMHWHSRLEKNFETSPAHSILLTPFCDKIAYDYYDSQSRIWRTEAGVEKDSDGIWRLPLRIRLHFAYKRFESERTILVGSTVNGGGLPPF